MVNVKLQTVFQTPAMSDHVYRNSRSKLGRSILLSKPKGTAWWAEIVSTQFMDMGREIIVS